MGEGYAFTVDESGLIYRFRSVGHRNITKLVSFDYVGDFFNCALGDEKDGLNKAADFEVNSNNGDIIKTLNTVTSVIEHFSSLHPRANIFISGFDVKRQSVYQNRIKRYLNTGTGRFDFLGWKGPDAGWETFNENQHYLGLLAVPKE